jgi:glucokinase
LRVQAEDWESGEPYESVVEEEASGWAIAERAKAYVRFGSPLMTLCGGKPERITAEMVAKAAGQGESTSREVLESAMGHLADAICQVIALLCPRRIVIGGGVSLIGEAQFFKPLRKKVAENVFRPFAGLTKIVPAALGEEVVVHGALALARQRTHDTPIR